MKNHLFPTLFFLNHSFLKALLSFRFETRNFEDVIGKFINSSIIETLLWAFQKFESLSFIEELTTSIILLKEAFCKKKDSRTQIHIKIVKYFPKFIFSQDPHQSRLPFLKSLRTTWIALMKHFYEKLIENCQKRSDKLLFSFHPRWHLISSRVPSKLERFESFAHGKMVQVNIIFLLALFPSQPRIIWCFSRKSWETGNFE